MKKVWFVFMAAVLVLTLGAGLLNGVGALSPVSASGIEVVVHGRPLALSQDPISVNGVTLVPLRGLAESLGSEVDWDKETKTATARKNGLSVQLTVGSLTATKNNYAITLDAAPSLVDGTLMAPLRFIGETFDQLVRWDAPSLTAYVEELPQLPSVGSYEELKTRFAELQNMRGPAMPETAKTGNMKTDAASNESAAPAAREMKSVSAEASSDYSATNVQVQGVDEADIVKTDGTYIYQVNRQRVIVAQAAPADAMRVVSTLDFKETSFMPQEMYVDDRHLIVIGGVNPYKPTKEVGPMTKMMIGMPIYFGMQSTKAIVYDISDKSQIKQLREIELDGQYLTSRKVGSAVYLLTNKTINIYTIMNENKEVPDAVPSYRDSITGEDKQKIAFGDIRFIPKSKEPNYLIVAGINLEQLNEKAHVAAYLGAGQNVYASDKHLYVTMARYEPLPLQAPVNDKGRIVPPSPNRYTSIYKFRLDQGKTQYLGSGEVPGTVLNQFSMDEYQGYFRIATTTGEVWRNDEYASKNNLYVLDEGLKTVGNIEDIAPGERIYSVRFIGTRGYMVTFRNVDPLFVLDLNNPQSPKILGKLKIPGYSDYLHPYDENHLIGFGKDTVELSNPSGRGTTAYYQGMKMAMFDVTDVEHPVEQFKTTIGDRGTYSELLNNHKMLLFSKEKNLLAFPVTVMEVRSETQGNTPKGFPAYGQFAFQGAYVYRIDLQNGFTLRGKISHLSGEDMMKSGNGWYNSEHNVERILYIRDTLYTLSKGMIKANDLGTLQEKGSLVLP